MYLHIINFVVWETNSVMTGECVKFQLLPESRLQGLQWQQFGMDYILFQSSSIMLAWLYQHQDVPSVFDAVGPNVQLFMCEQW